MKIERWEDETDEDWAERLAEAISIAEDTETTKYFIERDRFEEDGVIINFVGETGLIWCEHPEGPFTAKQILDWKKNAENLAICEGIVRGLLEDRSIAWKKLEALKTVLTEEVNLYKSERENWTIMYRRIEKILEDSNHSPTPKVNET